MKFTFKEAEDEETASTTPMSDETKAWLESLPVVVVSPPVVFELDVLNRLCMKENKLAYTDKTGKDVRGKGLLRFLEDEGRLDIFQEIRMVGLIEIANLLEENSVPGEPAEKDYFDVAVPYWAREYGYRLITCDPFLQAAPGLKTGW